MNSKITAKELSVGYGRRVILSGIELKIQAGEIVSLIGPNGSGKSTLLRSIAAQLKTIAGCIYIDDSSISGMKENDIAKKLSIVMTNRIDPELMTCEEVVEAGRYPYTGRLGILSENDHMIVRESMESVRISELKNVSFGSISDGQRQRVMLAKAICQEPEILILDEPTTFLDIRHKLELLSLLKILAREKNITVIMSLHEIGLAEKISDRVICIKDKGIHRQGRPDEIFSRDYINELYDIDDELLELAGHQGLV